MSVDVTVYDGKYRYIFDSSGARALRHGEEWRDCCGDKFILALAQDLDGARRQRDDLKAALRDILNELDRLEPDPIEQQWKCSPMRKAALDALSCIDS